MVNIHTNNTNHKPSDIIITTLLWSVCVDRRTVPLTEGKRPFTGPLYANSVVRLRRVHSNTGAAEETRDLYAHFGDEKR